MFFSKSETNKTKTIDALIPMIDLFAVLAIVFMIYSSDEIIAAQEKSQETIEQIATEYKKLEEEVAAAEQARQQRREMLAQNAVKSLEEIERELEGALLGVVHGADEPVVAAAAGDDRVLADLAVDHAGFVPGGGDVCEELQFGLVADDTGLAAGSALGARGAEGTVVPIDELPGAVETHGFRQLIGVTGIAIDATIIVADGVVTRAGDHPCEQDPQRLFICGTGFVSADAFLRHQIRVRPRVAGRAILVVDIDHQPVRGGLADRFVQP